MGAMRVMLKGDIGKIIRRSGALRGSAKFCGATAKRVLSFTVDFLHVFSSVLSLLSQNSTQHKCCITTAEMQSCVARTVTETVTSTLSLALSITTLKPGSDAPSASESTYFSPQSLCLVPCKSLAPALSSVAQRLLEFGNADA